jgi:hypothetical protein
VSNALAAVLRLLGGLLLLAGCAVVLIFIAAGLLLARVFESP